MLATFSNMLRDEEGATLVEYALIVALIAVVAIAAVSLLGNMAAPGQPAVQVDRMELFGDRGSLSLEGDTLNCTGAVQREKTYDLAACYQAAYDGVIAHFIDALQTGAPFETSPDDNLKTLQLVEDAYRLAAWPH